MSDYITTGTKIHFYPAEPEKEDITIKDIAHSLSLMTRANGHFPEFYSVGQHCLACAAEAKERGYSDRLVLACLLHDASEAYIADITRPVKRLLPEYLVIEKRLQDAIYERFLGSVPTAEEQEMISSVDDTLLFYEFDHYMGEKLLDYVPKLFSNPEFSFVPFETVEHAYIDMANQYAQIVK